MGFGMTIVACAAGDKDALLKAANLTETATADDANEAAYSGATFGPHYLIWRNAPATLSMEEPDYATMSQSVAITVLDVEEMVGMASTRAFKDGAIAWLVSGIEDGFAEEVGAAAFSIEGEAPFDEDALRTASIAHMATQLEGVDPSEIETDAFGMGHEAFAIVTGYRHEDAAQPAFMKLEGDMPLVHVGP